ncbi:hypothetical protein PC115_g5541 [Phytophthora cactorum]|uniref:Uncharacterized protein n=1 Tax=Phytophthora cactorum TaxID=29920 RepID=A0A8T1D2L5_9STRA|nr:hypothetical protein PC115_g5541 [Phytophthora cactorum]
MINQLQREETKSFKQLKNTTASRGFATAASDPETPSKWPKQQLITAFGRLREQGGAAARGTWHRERQEGRF